MKHATSDVNVYRVGVLADLFRLRRSITHAPWVHKRKGITSALRSIRRHWRRRSAWNGYLAEASDLPRAGHGWTKRRALRDLDLVRRTTHWAQHSCGTVRLRAAGAHYCVTCDRKDPYGWAIVEDAR